MLAELKKIALFGDLSEGDLAALASDAAEVDLPAGHYLFKEGDEGDRAYVITRGDVEILKRQQRGPEVLLAVRGEGEVLGEISLLLDEPRSASVRAKSDVSLVAFSRTRFEELLASSPTAIRGVFGVVLERWRNTESKLRHSARLAQLGTLTAGMMHELNNPASAVSRSATLLPGLVDELLRSLGKLPDVDATGALDELAGRRPADEAKPVSPLDLNDREESLEDWFVARNDVSAFGVACRLAPAGFTSGDLDAIEADLGDHAIPFIRHLAVRCELESLLTEARRGSQRISAIIDTLKSYTFVDQAPVQDVDLVTGITNTIGIMGNTLGGIEVVVDAEPQLPPITAHAAELNQVWTSLLSNAADAIAASGRDDGRITIDLRADEGAIAVSIGDNGVGIAPEHLDRVFDPFFTTKPPGAGTGLGLDVASNTVVNKHHGRISVESAPGDTVFRVELPATRA